MSKVVRGTQEGVAAWSPPQFGTPECEVNFEADIPSGTDVRLLTVAQIEQLEREAYKKSFDLGYADGLTQSKQTLMDDVNTLQSMLANAAQPLANLDRALEENVVALALTVAKQIVRREVQADPKQIVAVVREAMEVLPAKSRELTVFMHPEDMRVFTKVSTEQMPANCTMTPDPSLSRGSCKILSDESFIDATIEGKIAKIAASLLGGDRDRDPVVHDID